MMEKADNPYKLPEKLLYEVITRTIKFDNLSNEIIRTSFGLEIEEINNGDEWQILNLKEIQRFDEFFLENIGSSSRADILLRIIEETYLHNKDEIKPCKDFKGKLIKFYNIRNIFAHNLYPKRLDKKSHPDLKVPNWEELAKEHEDLYNELYGFLDSSCFTPVSF